MNEWADSVRFWLTDFEDEEATGVRVGAFDAALAAEYQQGKLDGMTVGREDVRERIRAVLDHDLTEDRNAIAVIREALNAQDAP